MRFIQTIASVALIGWAATAGSQGFGVLKSNVTLQRKLPALVQLPGTSVSIVVTGHSESAELTPGFSNPCSTPSFFKGDPRLEH